MIFKLDRFTIACNNLTVSRLVHRNYDRDLRRFCCRTVQNLYQILISPRSAPTIASRMSKNIGFDTLIIWIRLRLHNLPSNRSRPLIVFITLRYFFLWLVIAASLHGMPCAMPPWARRARLVVRHWRWSHQRLRVYHANLSIIEPWRLHLDQYTLKVIGLYLRTYLNFLVVFFILMPSSNSIDSTFSASSRALKAWTNTFRSDTICCNEIDMLWYQLLRA